MAKKPARPASKKALEASKRALKILKILEKAHPEAACALTHEDPYQLSVATILSAQCTDERVNKVTPALFERYPNADALATADLPEVESLIRSTGFYHAKAKNLVKFAQALVANHGGKVPHTMEELVKLPGFGRKTSNVVLGHAFDLSEGIAVDTHVLRLSGRLGLAKGKDPIQVEKELMALVPKRLWTRTTDLLIFHGRKICDARKPLCGECPLFSLCRWESRAAYATLEGKK